LRWSVGHDAPSSCVDGKSRPVMGSGSGRFAALSQIGSSVDIAPRLRELITIALLAGLGLGLASARGDLIFVAVFVLAISITIVEAMRRFR
jgi:hypothetical protein